MFAFPFTLYSAEIEDPNWTPAELSLSAWWDPSDASTVTPLFTAAAQVDDISGNNNHLILPTGIGFPPLYTETINGLNVLTFNGTDQGMDMTTTLDMRDKSFWCVTEKAAILATKAYLGKNDANTQFRWLTTGKLSYGAFTPYWSVNSFTSHPIVTVGEPVIISWITPSEGLSFSIDGTHYSGGNNALGTDYNFDALGYHNNGLNPVDAKIGEMVIPSGNLTIDERYKLEGYLAHKWFGAGVLNTLPFEHPHKYTSPLKGIPSIPYFTPRDITASIWLDATDPNTITHILGSVSQWDNKRGVNFVSVGGGTEPLTTVNTINSLNVIEFDGTDWMSGAMTWPTNGDFTMMLLGRRFAGGENSRVVIGTGDGTGSNEWSFFSSTNIMGAKCKQYVYQFQSNSCHGHNRSKNIRI